MVGKTLSLGLVLLSASAYAAGPKISHIQCHNKAAGLEIEVMVDVLKSNPPQSQIVVTLNGKESGYTAFKRYALIETVGGVHQWTFNSADNIQQLKIEKDASSEEAAKGFYSVGRMRATEVICDHMH